MTGNHHSETQQAYAQARAYGKDLARLYAIEKERRKELETTSQKLRAIFDNVPTGLAVVDNDLTILEANLRFLALFEQTADCIGQSLATLLPIKTLKTTMQSIKTGSERLDSVEIELKQPVQRTLLIKLSPLSDNQGWVLVFHDLTEQKRLEGLKNEFINIAAHELRTPLAGVMGFVSVLREDVKDTDNVGAMEIIELILQSTDRLKAIIDELVDFATTQRVTEESLHISDIDLGRLFSKSFKILQSQIKAKGITYQVELPNEPLIIRGDQRILREAFYHLLENAVKFNKAQGKITVHAYYLPSASDPTIETEAETVIIEIKDTGIGIPQTELTKIFDKFYQVEEHLVRAIGGLGLGLTIAQRGLQRHGGQLSVTSQLGQGSIFQVTLPTVAQLSSVSIDNRLDVAYQQMLAYARDIAHAVAFRRKLGKKMEQIKDLSLTLTEELKHLSEIQSGTEAYTKSLNKTQKITQELVKVTTQPPH